MSSWTDPSSRFERTAARLFVVSTAVYLLLHCWAASAVKPLWMDEIISDTLVTDPSFPHALAALAHGADGGFPSYYFVAWPVAHLFGAGELTIRLVSSVFMAAAFGLLFGLLRHAYGLLPAMIAVGLSIGGSTLILYQNSELRFYADLFFSATVAVCGFDLLFRRASGGRWPFRAMALGALGHALLVLCHPFGIVYSAAISFAALVVFCWLQPTGFLGSYLISTLGGCAFFLLWIRGFLQQTHIVAGRGNLPVPSVPDFFRIYAQLAPLLYYDDRTKAWAACHFLPVRQHLAVLGLSAAVILGLLVLLWGVAKMLCSGRQAGRAAEQTATESPAVRPSDVHLLILAVTFVLVPAGIWVTSHLGKPLFIHRYFIPSVLGFAIIYAHLIARLRRWAAARGGGAVLRQSRLARALVAVAALLFAGIYLAWPLLAALSTPDGHLALRARIAGDNYGLPEVCENTNTFWQMSHYAPEIPCWFILDRQVAFDPRNGISAAPEFVFSQVLAAYYPRLRILSTGEFLRRFPAFMVDTVDGGTFWYDMRLRGNPAYTARPIPGAAIQTLRVARTAPP